MDYKIYFDEDFKKNSKKLKFINDSFQGGMVYKDAGYLWQYHIEDDENIYKRRLERSYLYNLVQSIVEKYRSFIFSKKPLRIFKNDEELFNAFLDNITLDKKDEQDFFEEIFKNLLLDEEIYVFVDKRSEDNSPYAQIIKRTNVIKKNFNER